jgi:hypothetical protein
LLAEVAAMRDNGAMVSPTRGRAHRFAAALTALSLVFGTLPAVAQTAAEKETARAMMKDGRAKRDKGDHKGALESFAAADGIMKLPTTGLEVGRSQTDLGQLVEARDTFLRVARHPEQSGEPAAFKDARKEAADLAAKLEDRIPALKLTVTGATGAPAVNIDGSDIAAATLAGAIKLNPGSHHIAVTAKGAQKSEVDVELKEGETKEQTIELKAATAAPVETPVKEDTLPPEAPPSSGTSPLVYVGFGLAGVGIVLGSVTGMIAMSKTNAAKEQCDGTRCPPATHDDLSSARTMATVSTISFAAAAVGLGVGIYGLVASKGSTAEPPKASLGPLRRLEPVVGFGVIGLTGAF